MAKSQKLCQILAPRKPKKHTCWAPNSIYFFFWGGGPLWLARKRKIDQNWDNPKIDILKFSHLDYLYGLQEENFEQKVWDKVCY
jgi:hypothetical protein